MMVKSKNHDGETVDHDSSWNFLTENELADEKLDKWGWVRISSEQNKSTGRNDGYFYLSPKTKKDQKKSL